MAGSFGAGFADRHIHAKIQEMALYPFPIHSDDHVRARNVAGRAYSLSEVYRAAYKIGRAVWDARRPDIAGEPVPRATPSDTATLPRTWCQWPDDTRWAPSACARWCVHVGLAFVEVRMPPKAGPPGVILLVSSGRIVYPRKLAATQHGMDQIAAFADAQGWGIDWVSEVGGDVVSSAIYALK